MVQDNDADDLIKEFSGKKICRLACYFTLLPDTKDYDIISEVNTEKYVILDSKTLAVKSEVKRLGGWYKIFPPGPKVQEPFNTLITPDLQVNNNEIYKFYYLYPRASRIHQIKTLNRLAFFQVISVKSSSGQPSIVLLSMSAHMITGKVYVMSFLMEKRKRVRIVDQVELPVTNAPGSFGLNFQRGIGDESDWVYVKLAWSSRNEADKTVLSLARVKTDSEAKIEYEELAEKRSISGHWSASGFVKYGFVWLLTEDEVGLIIKACLTEINLFLNFRFAIAF